MSLTSGKQLLLSAAAGGGATGYQISRSLRFNSADSAYLSRTPGSAGNRKTWTWAGWVKRTKSSSGLTYQSIFTAGIDGNNNSGILFDNSDRLEIWNVVGNVNVTQKITSQVFRDFSSWYHLVVSATTSTLSVYVNGVEVTAWNTNNQPGNEDWSFNTTNAHYLARYWDGGSSFPGDFYLADIYFIDGQALDPTSFGEFDATTGVWNPKAYTGSYGTNGFHLEFADNSAATATTLGKDTSGNGNNWSVNNLSVITGGPTSVASASGALPIYNTTGTYGDTKGSGTRTDSNSSSIVLAIPMDGTNNGTTFTDESATIKGSGSAKSITRNGDAKTSTTQSKYYGSSGYFDGSGDYLTVNYDSDLDFTGQFTMEAFVYPSVSTGDHSVFGNFTVNATGYWGLVFDYGTYGVFTTFYYQGNTNVTNTGYVPIPGTWNHYAVTRDASNVIRVFLNGQLLPTTATYSGTLGVSGQNTFIAFRGGLSSLNGFIQDVRFYKGVAKYTSNFAPPSSTQNASIAAGNDSIVDVPTTSGTDTGAGGEVRGNYCTLNAVNTYGSTTLSNGNLEATLSTGGSSVAVGTIAVTSGKWYWEVTPTGSSNQWNIGVADAAAALKDFTGANGWYYYADGRKVTSLSYSSYGSSFTGNDVIGVALDMDAGSVTFYKNNVSQGTAFNSGLSGKSIQPALNISATNSNAFVCNFGQRPFAYTAPSGFKALCTANLPAPLVTKPSTVMDVALYTGNGSTQTISGLGFSPDFVWTKTRSQANNNFLFDSVRGVGNWLISDLTTAETYSANTLTSFNSDGFTTGSNNDTNASGRTFVAWCWDAGSSTVTNTAGSITSSVRANATAGFSVVTYTGNGTNGATIGHGLGVKPSLLICKRRDSTSNWQVYHSSLGATKYLTINSTNSSTTDSGAWNDTEPTSSVFTVGTFSDLNGNGATCVTYAFAPVAGYSNAFSYSGNGSSDGPMVHLGFRPRLILLKRTDAAYGWYMYDTARDTYNIAGKELLANDSSAEVSDSDIDILSNGFKPRRSSLAFNASGGTFVGFAWAESPFNYARAR